jgi:hypothetical protein
VSDWKSANNRNASTQSLGEVKKDAMKPMQLSLGPWTTSLNSGSRLELSAFWQRRMSELPRLRNSLGLRCRAQAMLVLLIGLLAGLPLLEICPGPARADESPASNTKEPPKENEAAAASPAKDQGSELLRRLTRKGAPLLKLLRDQHGYALPEDENLKRVAPPFPKERMEWYRVANPTQHEHIPAGPDAMLFRWENGGLRNWGMSFGHPNNIDDILTSAAGVYPQMIEGPAKLREQVIPGDWIVRPGAPPENVVAELETILNRDLSRGVRLRFAEIEREAYVARGKYKFDALPGYPAVDETQLTDRISRTDPIQVYGGQLAPNSGAGGGTGDLAHFFDWVGRWIGMPIVSEVEQPPSRDVSWQLHEPSPSTSADRALARDPELVLKNIARQTGLEFVREKRPIKVLIVESVEPIPPNENPGSEERSP